MRLSLGGMMLQAQTTERSRHWGAYTGMGVLHEEGKSL